MNEIVKITDGQLIATKDYMNTYLEKKKIAEEFELMDKEFKQAVRDIMDKNNIEKISGPGIYAELKWSKGRKSIDTKRLEQELPDIYEEYLKQGDPYSSLTLKIAD